MNNELTQDEQLMRDKIYSMSDEEFQNALYKMEVESEKKYNQQPEEDIEQTINEEDNEPLDNSVSDDEPNAEPEPIKDNEEKKEVLEQEQSQTTSNEDSDDNSKTKTQQTYKVKANGSELELTIDELIQLAPKALNYTAKLQKLAPYRRAISALEEKGITEEELNQLIEIREGNSIAIRNLLDKNNIPTSSITGVEETESKEYKPQEYGEAESDIEWKELISNLQRNPHYETMRLYVNDLDDQSKELLRQNPQAFENLLSDIEAGVFNESVSLAQKKKLMENGSKQPDILYYISSAQALWDKKRAELEKQVKNKSKSVPQPKGNKSNAKLSGDKALASKQKKVAEMMNDIDDEDYQNWLQNVLSSR